MNSADFVFGGFFVRPLHPRSPWDLRNSPGPWLLNLMTHSKLSRGEESFSNRHYRKSSIKPPGAYLILDLPEGGLNREGGLLERGGLFTKSSEKDIFGSFSVPLFHILRIQQTIFRLKYTDSTHFLSHIILKLTCKIV